MSRLRIIASPVGAEIVLDGKQYANFAGSSYLGLSYRSEILDAGAAALRASGAGYQFARDYQIATGAHLDAEAAAAEFFGSEGALYLSTGYYFGWVAIGALRAQYSRIFVDEWAHHCLRDAIAASGLPGHSFKHLDVADLEAQLNAHMRPGERPLVATDGMYSTFGDIAPLADFAKSIAPYEGRLVVDESHSFGVVGPRGRGACEHHDLCGSPIVLQGGSTGKALGVLGGIIPANHADLVALRTVPASRGSSIGQPAAAAMCAMSFKYVREHPELLARLRENIAYLKAGMRRLGLQVGDTLAPIASFSVPGVGAMQALRERLLSEGIHVLHSNYIGAGPAGVIRCTIFADHRREQLDQLLDALKRLL
jgi:7-keto-8-aminopelargonate synthetase-like enzyme